MTLLELCQPVFNYVCLLNRSARKGVSYDRGQVRAQVLAIMADASSKARVDPRLEAQYRKIEPVLLIFIDGMIKESRLAFARDWKELAREQRNISDGDERFFDLLEESLHDPSPNAPEVLKVFYACLGLGFSGFYAGNANHIHQRMLEIVARTRLLDDPNARIVPEAYDHVNTSNLIEPPAASVTGIVIAFVGLIIVALGITFYIYHNASRGLDKAFQTILSAPGTQQEQSSWVPTYRGPAEPVADV